MTDWEPRRTTVNRKAIRDSIRRHRRVLNRLEPHLGCVVCHGPLAEGVCPTCDQSDGEADG